MSVLLGIALGSFVGSVMSNTTKWELALTAPPGTSGAHRGLESASCWDTFWAVWSSGSTNINLGHIRTHRPQSPSRALSCSEWTDVYSTTFFFLGFVQWIKKKKAVYTNYSLLLPLFCFALSFFPYIKNCSCEETLPSCFLEQALP